MKTPQSPSVAGKASTGVAGFDEMKGGGLPSRRTTLSLGGPSSGKTIFALQVLIHGAKACKQPDILVAFAQTPVRIIANFEGFGWNVAALRPQKIFFLDAQPMPDLIQTGNFDFGGILASLGAQVAEMGATRIVFNALDIVLALLPDAAWKRREIYRLHTSGLEASST